MIKEFYVYWISGIVFHKEFVKFCTYIFYASFIGCFCLNIIINVFFFRKLPYNVKFSFTVIIWTLVLIVLKYVLISNILNCLQYLATTFSMNFFHFLLPFWLGFTENSKGRVPKALQREAREDLVKLSERTSLVAQMVKSLPAMQETWVLSLGGEDLLEKEMATHVSILAWRIPWTEEPGEPQSMGLLRVRH